MNMPFNPSVFASELTSLEIKMKSIVYDLLSMFCDADEVTINVAENFIEIEYLGLGSEHIGLGLSDKFPEFARINYLKETIARLEKIKCEVSELVA